MVAADILQSRREDILRIARRHGVGRVRVFGSYARGNPGEASDLDLLIEVDGPTSPWFPGGLVAELEALAGVDIEGLSRPTTAPASQPAGKSGATSRPGEPTTQAAS